LRLQHFLFHTPLCSQITVHLPGVQNPVSYYFDEGYLTRCSSLAGHYIVDIWDRDCVRFTQAGSSWDLRYCYFVMNRSYEIVREPRGRPRMRGMSLVYSKPISILVDTKRYVSIAAEAFRVYDYVEDLYATRTRNPH